jgi:uncharacterized membrane protein YcaP (DUF421 family)
MNVDDLMDSLRASGHFNPSDVQYAILETNGKLSVLPKAENKNVTPADLGLTVNDATLPYILITEGKIMDNGLNSSELTLTKINTLLRGYELEPKDVFLMILDGDKDYYIQPYKGKAIKTTILEKQ